MASVNDVEKAVKAAGKPANNPGKVLTAKELAQVNAELKVRENFSRLTALITPAVIKLKKQLTDAITEELAKLANGAEPNMYRLRFIQAELAAVVAVRSAMSADGTSCAPSKIKAQALTLLPAMVSRQLLETEDIEKLESFTGWSEAVESGVRAIGLVRNEKVSVSPKTAGTVYVSYLLPASSTSASASLFDAVDTVDAVQGE